MDIHQKVGERLFFLGAEVNCAQAAESGKKKDITTSGSLKIGKTKSVTNAGMLILSTLYPTSEWVVEDEASAGTRPVNAWTP